MQHWGCCKDYGNKANEQIEALEISGSSGKSKIKYLRFKHSLRYGIYKYLGNCSQKNTESSMQKKDDTARKQAKCSR